MIDLRFGDCLEILPTLDAGSVDAVVTDPPYGIGFKYESGAEIAKTPESYWEWLCPRYQEWWRCLKPGGFMAVWQAQLNFRHFWDWFGDGIRIYAACKNFVQIRPTSINYAYDPVIMIYKEGKPLRPEKPARNVDFFVGNTAGIVSDTKRIEHAHPCPRPLDQVLEIIQNFVIPGGVVLDPFLGSGTTAIACYRSWRRCIGIEVDFNYFAIAQRRIADEQAKMSLFAGIEA